MMRPRAVIFDVIGTIVGTEGVKTKLVKLGVPSDAAELWYARTTRDGMAGSLASGFASMREVAAYNVALLAHETGVEISEEEAVGIVDAIADAHPYPDLIEAWERLEAAGVRTGTLSNGSHSTTYRLLAAAGLAEGRLDAELMMQTSDAHAWKPHAAAYAHAVTVLSERKDIQPHEALLVSAHPWDVNGALAAGLRGVYLCRTGRPYPPFFRQPEATVPSLGALADMLLLLPADGGEPPAGKLPALAPSREV